MRVDVMDFNENDAALQPFDFGSLQREPENKCRHCKALLFKGETSSLCCHNGTTSLPYVHAPEVMKPLFLKPMFVKHLRKINNMFALASMGMSHVGPPADGNRFQGSLKVEGKLYHKIGNINPPEGLEPVYLQLYFMDTEAAFAGRRSNMNEQELDEADLRLLHDLIPRVNPYVRDIKMAVEIIREKATEEGGDRVAEGSIVIAHNKQSNRPADAHERTYNMPQASEIAGIIIGEQQIERTKNGGVQLADIVLQYRPNPTRRLDCVNSTHRAYDCLMYVLMFPCGEDGWHRGRTRTSTTTRNGEEVVSYPKMSEMDFYSFRIMVRDQPGDFNIVLKCGRLFQQYVIDQWAKIEAHRLMWCRNNQAQLRAELYHVMVDVVNSGDVIDREQAGNRIVLPPSQLGSPRWYKERYQNGMAICRAFGKPDYFVTATANPAWKAIKDSLLPGQTATDRPDVVARVFQLVVKELLVDLVKKQALGRCVAHVASVEWQKRGLPHIHILLWVADDDKPVTPEVIDKVISAEIPDKTVNPELYELVTSKMIHGPCGADNPRSVCMKDGRCGKGFPKEYRDKTQVLNDMYPEYRRRSIAKGGHFKMVTRGHGANQTPYRMDNSNVVPYNPALTKKYETHINVEGVHSVLSIKYIFKYLTKGPDRLNIRVTVEDTPQEQPQLQPQGPPPPPDAGAQDQVQEHPGGFADQAPQQDREVHRNMRDVDEIEEYQSARYLSSPEAAHKILGFELHYNYPAVEKLPIHLPGDESVIFDEAEGVNEEQIRNGPPPSKLTLFFELCDKDPEARARTYPDVVRYYCFVKKRGQVAAHWKKRVRGPLNDLGQIETDNVGRIPMVPMARPELYHLRLLLFFVKGPRSFEDLRKTDEGQVLPTFQQAAVYLGLVPNDDMFREIMYEAKEVQFPKQLRRLFCTLLVYHTPANALDLWEDEEIRRCLVEDFRRQSRSNHVQQAHVQAALADMEDILYAMGKPDIREFGLPVADRDQIVAREHLMVQDELNYNAAELQTSVAAAYGTLNAEQRQVFDEVLESVEAGDGKFFCLNASGGTGKTYVTNLILDAVRGKSMIALATATSGIAATLLHGGRTLHSRFKVPIELDEESYCRMNPGIKAVCHRTKLIVIDEVTMGHRYLFECLDRSLRDVMGVVDAARSEQPFGGITVLCAGDWRQILPVVIKGRQAQIVGASLLKSPLWANVVKLQLVTNMRVALAAGGEGGEAGNEVAEFVEFLDSVGTGRIPPVALGGDPGECVIQVPEDLIFRPEVHPAPHQSREQALLLALVEHVFFSDQHDQPLHATPPPENETFEYAIKHRAIICPTNRIVAKVNEEAIHRFPGVVRHYPSSDVLHEEDHGEDVGTEVLNTLTVPGFPDHRLALKEGAVIMLIRNLDPSNGHCNGTRYVVRRLNRHTIDAEVATGAYRGQRILIPRLKFPTGPDYPFCFTRTQFPVRLAFAITANKSQGQTYQKIGICLHHTPFFTHGQLYVALSRVGKRQNIAILLSQSAGDAGSRTSNVVYQQVLRDGGVIQQEEEEE